MPSRALTLSPRSEAVPRHRRARTSTHTDRCSTLPPPTSRRAERFWEARWAAPRHRAPPHPHCHATTPGRRRRSVERRKSGQTCARTLRSRRSRPGLSAVDGGTPRGGCRAVVWPGPSVCLAVAAPISEPGDELHVGEVTSSRPSLGDHRRGAHTHSVTGTP